MQDFIRRTKILSSLHFSDFKTLQDQGIKTIRKIESLSTKLIISSANIEEIVSLYKEKRNEQFVSESSSKESEETDYYSDNIKYLEIAFFLARTKSTECKNRLNSSKKVFKLYTQLLQIAMPASCCNELPATSLPDKAQNSMDRKILDLFWSFNLSHKKYKVSDQETSAHCCKSAAAKRAPTPDSDSNSCSGFKLWASSDSDHSDTEKASVGKDRPSETASC